MCNLIKLKTLFCIRSMCKEMSHIRIHISEAIFIFFVQAEILPTSTLIECSSGYCHLFQSIAQESLTLHASNIIKVRTSIKGWLRCMEAVTTSKSKLLEVDLLMPMWTMVGCPLGKVNWKLQPTQKGEWGGESWAPLNYHTCDYELTLIISALLTIKCHSCRLCGVEYINLVTSPH